MQIMRNLPLLLNAAYVAFNREDFIPKEGKTFCNLAMQYICNCFGYDAFNGKTANEMIDYMNDLTTGWLSVSDLVAQNHANQGVIVIAGRKNPEGHGHVCLVLPGILEKSGSYSRSVPKVVNIGKNVFFGKRISEAFKVDQQPSYYALSQMIV